MNCFASGTPTDEINSAFTEREFSTANFYAVKDSPRKVCSFNPGWRFVKKDIKGAEKKDLDDSKWQVVNLPHGLELLPENASGCVNYQGVAWYRKKFEVSSQMIDNERFVIHFESIMGKSEIYLNGKMIKKQLGGFLPIHLDLTEKLLVGENLIAVKTDNSDDKEYPPGKTQEQQM